MQQVGSANNLTTPQGFPGATRAALWSGTAASLVGLHPDGAFASEANGVSNGRQAGWATFAANQHAGYWSGTAASWVDLHPAGATDSRATDIFGDTWSAGPRCGMLACRAP
jgi:hypothetical protein